MPLIDQFLSAMLKKGAIEFQMRPGAKPFFKMPDGAPQSFSRILTAREILHLINELRPEYDRISESHIREYSFPYTMSDGSIFLVGVHREKDAFLVICRTEDAVTQVPIESSPPPPAEAPSAAERIVIEAPDRLTMDFLFHLMKDSQASDLHLSANNHPAIRVDGDIVVLAQLPMLSEALVLELIKEVITQRSAKEFQETGDTDFAYELQGVGRFRSNCFRDRRGPGAVFRLIPEKIVTVEDLGLSQKIQNLCYRKKGLVLVTGPTGCGKSTTLSALIDLCNRKRHDHIITIEEPIEFVHENKECLINQREVGLHTDSFKHALRAALREDPDIVLVGEMRDLETIAIAIETAVTGHLVFATLHTSSAASTIDRIIDQFPPNQQSQIRVMLADSLKGVISQILLKRKGGGRVAAIEVMIGTPSISNLIREAKTFQIPSIMQTSRGLGMVTMNDALLDLIKENRVEVEEAALNATDKDGFIVILKRNNIGFDPAILAS